MNKINLLLIDDNPKFCWLSLKDAVQLGCLSNNGYTDAQLAKKIPVVINDAPSSEGDHWNALKKHFNLKWLQSPLDVREYYDLSTEIESRFTSAKLGQKGFVPEIICFDYALSDMMDMSYYDYESDREVLSTINPNYALVDFFATELNETKTLHRHLENVPLNYKTDTQANMDNMGCYAGGITAFMFRNHPCSAVPVTFKTKDKVEGKDAGYFEWLLHNEFDQIFDWEERGEEKSWYKIIKIAVENLRKRIMNYIQSRKILPVYNALLKLSVGEFEKDEGVFTFYSIYGERQLPLDGLFIEFDNDTRKDKISKWAQELLDKLYQQKGYSLSTFLLDNAFKFSNELWNRYKDTESVLQRLKISELGYLLSLDNDKLLREIKEKNNSKIVAKVREELHEEYNILTKRFGIRVDKKKIKSKREINGNDKEKDEFAYRLEFGYDLRNGNFSTIERRWGVLITLLRLHHHFLKFYFSIPDENISHFTFLKSQPDEKDYYLALFPIAQSPIVTLFHKSDGDNFKNALKRQTCYKNTTEGDYGFELDSIINCIRDKNGILPEEIYLIKSIARDKNEFPYYQDENNLPQWLKK